MFAKKDKIDKLLSIKLFFNKKKMSRYRNSNVNIVKTLKDYAVPLIWLFLILILLFNVFSGNDNSSTQKTNTDTTENLSQVKIELAWEGTKAYIVYQNWKKVELTDTVSFNKWEKLSIEEWKAIIVSPLQAKFVLSKNWELEYKSDWSFFLGSWNLWVEAMSNLKVYMKYANVFLEDWAIANLSQNAVESVIYNIDGNIKVSTLYGLEKQLEAWKKIIIKATNTTKADFDFKSSIQDIDMYFKNSAWFKENGWDLIVLAWNQDSNSGTLNTPIENQNIGDLISFDNLTDESYSKENPLQLKWRYETLKVWKITIDNNEVKLDSKLWTFSYSLALNDKVNDIVIKIYDKDGNLLTKQVFTIYTNNASSTTSKQQLNSKLENYKVNPANFIIYEPSKNWSFTTTSWQVTIRWKVLDKKVKAVLVNDYKLRSFNWSTWRYHAFVDQWTLKDWANLYEIKYIWDNNKVLYKEYYNIYKKLPQTTTKKISDEARLEN